VLSDEFEHDGEVIYYTLKDILPGEEVTIDYRRMDDIYDNLSRDQPLPGRKPPRKRKKTRRA
jgi:SET domain-containing protein